MRTKIVLWGTNAEDERVLLAIALRSTDNMVDIWIFSEKVATEDFYNRLINEWRFGRDVPFPNEFIQIERPLTASENILPDNLKVERTDVVQRAQTEWHFVVLSAKLFSAYKDELQELRERVDALTSFDNAIWEELKGFWDKVRAQIQDKNLFQEHRRKLQDQTNELFSRMKEMRKALDEEFKVISKQHKEKFLTHIHEIENRIGEGLGLQPIFEELKDLQRRYRQTRFTREDRSKVWEKLDKAFKVIKEKRYGPGYKREHTPGERLKRRYNGLIAAIEKMENSIARDKREMQSQDRRIEASDGQLESQLLQAKMKMIQERINSKEDKLQEMLKTKAELEKRLQQEAQREERRKEKAKVEEAKKAAKAKIAEEMKQAADERAANEEKLREAADSILDRKEGEAPASPSDAPTETIVVTSSEESPTEASQPALGGEESSPQDSEPPAGDEKVTPEESEVTHGDEEAEATESEGAARAEEPHPPGSDPEDGESLSDNTESIPEADESAGEQVTENEETEDVVVSAQESTDADVTDVEEEAPDTDAENQEGDAPAAVPEPELTEAGDALQSEGQSADNDESAEGQAPEAIAEDESAENVSDGSGEEE